MRVVLITKPGHADTGVGRYTYSLEKALISKGHDVQTVHPGLPLPSGWLRPLGQWLGWDLAAFFYNYPVWIQYPPADIYHMTSQNLATLLLWRRPNGRIILTVHDIIPWLMRHNSKLNVYGHAFEKLFDWLALRGLRRADFILTDSDHTKDTLLMELGTAVPPMKTVHLGIG